MVFLLTHNSAYILPSTVPARRGTAAAPLWWRAAGRGRGRAFYRTDGSRHTGWLSRPEGWYFMNGGGVMATGWLWDGTDWYFLEGSGAMVTGSVDIGGTRYEFLESGALVA